MKLSNSVRIPLQGTGALGVMVSLILFHAIAATGRTGDLPAVEGQRSPLLSGSAEPPVVYVDRDASGAKSGQSWRDAFKTIQEGIDAAAWAGPGGSYAEVWVAEGRYDERRLAGMVGGHGQILGSLTLMPGVAVYGGFDGTETCRDDRDWFAHETIIDGSTSRGGYPAYHVVLGADDAILDGFTITGGNASYAYESSGGGMLNSYCSPVVANCTFLRNKASDNGGGGIANVKASPRIINCRFYGNDGGWHAGGIYDHESSSEIVNCLFVGNQADEGGAMLCRQPAATRVINCTFVCNQAIGGGCLFSGLGGDSVRQISFLNSVLWADEATKGGDEVMGRTDIVSFSHCSIEEGINGPGFSGNQAIDAGSNRDENPRFVRMPDPGADGTWGTADDDYGDLRLTEDSTLINKGDDDVLPADVTTDVARHPRIMLGYVDLGAYEYIGTTDLWAVTLYRGWDDLPDGAAVEPGEAIRIGSHTLTPSPLLYVEASFSNGDSTRALELNAGGLAYDVLWHPTRPGSLPDGRIEITVCAAECEGCTPGRCVTRWVTMTGQTDKADLVGNDFSASACSLNWGDTIQIDFTVLNQGAAAAGATKTAFYLSRDSVFWTEGDVWLAQADIPLLEAGGLYRSQVSVQLPAAPPDGFQAPGTCYVGMVVDTTGSVPEDFEHNNMNRGEGADMAKVTLGQPAPVTIFNIRSFANRGIVNLVGSALITGGRLRLTDAQDWLAGGAWYEQDVLVRHGFETVFDFQVDRDGADGFAFVIQNVGTAALGTNSYNQGYDIPNSIAIEFDTWYNPEIGDPSENHVSVQTQGPQKNSPDHRFSLGCTSGVPFLSDNRRHTAKISYAPGQLRVFVDDMEQPILAVPMTLEPWLSSTDGWAFVGFTASTGGASEIHDILSWSLAVNSASY
ncbi:MAG: right-handed parallel beta-helix repeat-containing protein [Sedimentisphaerales bacterium]|nr:right-handed parallel beta-helix repeat-containing protein [Sedimentisphaerales bacterium]